MSGKYMVELGSASFSHYEVITSLSRKCYVAKNQNSFEIEALKISIQ